MDAQFLEDRRQVGFDWHMRQVSRWLKYDNGRNLDSVLVYAALELRCAIERYLFDIYVILKKGKLNPREEKLCRRKAAIVNLVRRSEPHYLRRATFTNLIASVTPGMPKVVVVDIQYLIRMWDELSKYCHKQIRAEESFQSSNRQFQTRGFTMIRDVLNRFNDWPLRRARGIIDVDSMPPETRDVYDKYVNGEIDENQARTMLDIAGPILRTRIRNPGFLTSN